MKKKIWASLLLVCGLMAAPNLSGCVSTQDGQQGVEFIENMDDVSFDRWQLYVSLTVKIGANRLLEEGIVTADELLLAADVMEAAQAANVPVGAVSLLEPLFIEVGLNNDEMLLVLLIVEQELLSHGVSLDTNLSLRTKAVLQGAANAIRAVILPPEPQ